MKTARHAKIIEIINKYNIETQEELADKLNEAGFQVTQATVSRDIRELKLMKISENGERQRYVVFQNKEGWIAEDARFNEFVRANYRNEYELAGAMRDYIESVVSCKMTEEEVIYLAVQLKYADIKKKEGKKNGIF